MTNPRAQADGALRHVFLTLAVMALFLRIAIPAGFMPERMAPGGPLTLVLCTADGAVTVDAKALGGQAPAKSGHDSPCAFAGLTAAAPPPALLDAGPATGVAYIAPTPVLAPAASPGRGLSGPPLPARGPPASTI